ncbi:MAG: hypothetical protein MUE73_14520 [Planctomycetes bacterium]|jgi:hypothetical protein|nr:hypothetical protein [Planctomycetota bacterium]
MAGLEALTDRLVAGGVEFVVVGGMAAVAHGSSALTRDIDVCISLSRDNLLRLHAALDDVRPVHRMTPARVPFVAPAAEHQGFENPYLQTDWGQVDCLGSIEGVGRYEDALRA